VSIDANEPFEPAFARGEGRGVEVGERGGWCGDVGESDGDGTFNLSLPEIFEEMRYTMMRTMRKGEEDCVGLC